MTCRETPFSLALLPGWMSLPSLLADQREAGVKRGCGGGFQGGEGEKGVNLAEYDPPRCEARHCERGEN